MVGSNLTLLLIPLIPGLALMLWVIWALERQISRDSRHRDANNRPKG